MNDQDSIRQNRLLAALSPGVFERISPHLERMELRKGTFVYESGDELRYAHFPTTCVISKLTVLENGASSEIGVVGNDGITGIALFMSGKPMPIRAVVQNAGSCYRIRAHPLMNEFNRHGGRRKGELHDLMLRYTQARIAEMTQTAVCNRLHNIDQQFCRWLLHSIDQLDSNELYITQESIANLLGVRRESITESAGKLQKAGVIHYSRGHIELQNRAALELKACECYRVVKQEFERLLPVRQDMSGVFAYSKPLVKSRPAQFGMPYR